MATKTPQEVVGLPGYYWQYQSGHGFKGRHAYNPSSGAAIPYRQVRYIREGRLTEQAYLDRSSEPIKTWETSNYVVSEYTTLYSAVNAAKNAEMPSYMVASGTLNPKYPGYTQPDEGDFPYRAVIGRTDPSTFKRIVPKIVENTEKTFIGYSVRSYAIWTSK